MTDLTRRTALAAVGATVAATSLLRGRPAAAQSASGPTERIDPASISPELSEQTVRVGEIDIHVVSGGSGPVVLLWHGFLGNWYSWHKVMPLLVADYTVVCPDMRGYGGSTTTDGGYDALTLKNDFRGLMQALGHERIHIMAHDMGAPPALLYAAEHPDEVATLTYLEEPTMLADTIAEIVQLTPEHSERGGLWWWMVAHSPDMTQRLIEGNERTFVDWFYDAYTVPEGAIDERARAYYAADLADERGIHGWFGVYRDLFQTIEQTEPYATNKIEVPILALGGSGSQGDGVREMIEQVASNVQGGTMEGAGHFIPEETPEELVARFRNFAGAT